MSEIDLIPNDCRESIQRRKVGKRFLYIFVCMIFAIALGKGWLEYLLKNEKMETDTLKNGEVFILNQRAIYEELNSKHNDLSKRLELLDLLRGGPSAELMFSVIDRAMNSSVWFTNLKYLRAGEDQIREPTTKNTGYFIVVPKDQKKSETSPWQSLMRMDIKGEALSHSALADFVKKLIEQPEIKDVQIQSTSTRRYAAGHVVEYSIAALINVEEDNPL